MFLLTAQEMRDNDQFTIEHVGLPGVVLMENAGRAVVSELKKRFSRPQTAVVLAGPGNNGGDGFVVARMLAQEGWTVYPWFIGSLEKMSADAKVHYRVCKHFVSIYHHPVEQWECLQQHVDRATVIVDAMLGIGTKGGLRPPFDRIASLVNQQKKAWVVAVDLPSGVETDTGNVSNEAVKADQTITFSFPKWGHLLRPGADYTGEWKVVDIGIVPARESLASINLPANWQQSLLPRSPWSHKGTFGHLLVIGGAEGMLGAAVMAKEAAFRTGVGKVTLTVPESQQGICASKVTQAMVWSWPGNGRFEPESYQCFLQRKGDFSAVAIGTGLGRFAGEERWLGNLLEQIEVPIVLDADALNILAKNPTLIQKRDRTRSTICTPHPGEMARLLQCSTKEVEENRATVARDFAQQTGMIVVLKGRYSIIAFPDGRQVVNTTGHPALAKAGSGDLLTGMIGSFLAQGYKPEEAVQIAVYIHGKAGEKAVRSSEYSVRYSDILAQLGPVLHQLTSQPAYFPGN